MQAAVALGLGQQDQPAGIPSSNDGYHPRGSQGWKNPGEAGSQSWPTLNLHRKRGFPLKQIVTPACTLLGHQLSPRGSESSSGELPPSHRLLNSWWSYSLFSAICFSESLVFTFLKYTQAPQRPKFICSSTIYS